MDASCKLHTVEHERGTGLARHQSDQPVDVIPVVRRAFDRMTEKHDRVYLALTVDEHQEGTSRLRGAVEDVDRELGRKVPR